MMLPTAYNNGMLIIQAPGYLVLHSEMIHNARIIPLDAGPPIDQRLDRPRLSRTYLKIV